MKLKFINLIMIFYSYISLVVCDLDTHIDLTDAQKHILLNSDNRIKKTLFLGNFTEEEVLRRQFNSFNRSLLPGILTSQNKVAFYNTTITVPSGSCNGIVNQKLEYLFKGDKIASVIHKLSLQSSSDSAVKFKISSSDVRLIEAKIMKNCFDDDNDTDHPYLCIISIFKEIDTSREEKRVVIEYEFEEFNFLRTDIKFPYFNTTQKEFNYISYDLNNYDYLSPIGSFNLELKLPVDLSYLTAMGKTDMNQSKIQFTKHFPSDSLESIQSFPLTQNINLKEGVFRWYNEKISGNSGKNFSLLLPLFNEKCKKTNDVRVKFSNFTLIQFFFTCTVVVTLVSLIGFLYINDRVDEQKWRLYEEINSIEKGMTSK